MSAVGVGVDLVEVSRARAMLADKGAHVFDRLLTPAEAEYCRSRPDPAEHVAVRLAAKEAVYKALQGSDAARGIGWRDIELRLLNEELCLVDLFGLGDLPPCGDDTEGVLLGCQGRGGNHAPRQGQRVRRLPCERLCKAGGDQEESFGQPHDKY